MNFHKMTGFLHVFEIFFSLCCLLFLCEGKVSAPSSGTILTFAPGSTGNISWSFDDVIDPVTRRIWSFTPSNGQPQVTLALIDNDGPAKIFTNLLDFEVEKPATLVLKNVNLTYNGTYQFSLSPSVGAGSSEVVVYIAVTPQVKVDCDSLSTVNVTDNFTCLCEASDGNPTAYVTWYKGKKKIGESGKEEQTLRLINVDRDDVGVYTCEAKRHDSAINRTEIELIVNYKPYNTRIIFIPTPAIVGNLVEIKCDSEGVPKPHFIIIRDSEEMGTGKSHVIPKLKPSDEGTYTCIAINLLGNDSATKNLNETAVAFPPTVISFTSTPENIVFGKSVVITCEAIAVPIPTYTIIHNNTVIVSVHKAYIITDLTYNHAGSYQCTAANRVGNSSRILNLTVTATPTTNSPNTNNFEREKTASEKCNCAGTEWYVVVGSMMSGIIIGLFLAYIFFCSRRRWFRNRKSERHVQPKTTEVDSTYQELDLTKMNKEDDYESLKVIAANNVAENEDNSTYTELNKTRNVENNYQSLT